MASSHIKTILPEPDKSSYVVTYLPLMGRSGLIRVLLHLAGAKVTHKVETYESVKEDRSKFPYGRVPVLEETQPDGSKFVLAEAIAIEQYLAEKYGLLSPLGEAPDLQLAAKIKSVALNTYLELSSNLFDPLFQKSDEQQEKFRNEILPLWITNHERLLRENGNNGHYFGDRLTLADLTVLNWLRVMDTMGIKMADDSPLKKLEETLKALPEWRGQYDYFHPFNANLGDEKVYSAAATTDASDTTSQETTGQAAGGTADEEAGGEDATQETPSKRRRA
ncbi:hypothetical protein BGZ73_007887 [Actinomortierella ambigua]|nr:hypothetical protein BGZ73_007887 [Actinomortierella ambigua]